MSAQLPTTILSSRAGDISHTALPVVRYGAASAPCREYLLDKARFPGDSLSLAFACAIAQALEAEAKPLIRGLVEESFQRLMQNFFPRVLLQNHADGAEQTDTIDEYDDLVALLMAHRRYPATSLEWLCHVIASASIRDNHLWQDMGLPNRNVLSQLMQENFPMLATKNTADMKWKKFFYRRLCEQEEILVCKSPNCADCCDYTLCFETEEA